MNRIIKTFTDIPTIKITVIVMIIAIICTMILFNTPPQEREWIRQEYYIERGETLWGIARQYCPQDMNIQEYICKIEKINNLSGANIYAGQKIIILEEVE